MKLTRQDAILILSVLIIAAVAALIMVPAISF